MKNEKVIGAALVIISKVTSCADGGCKITLDMPSDGNKELLSKLLDLALNPEPVYVSFVNEKA